MQTHGRFKVKNIQSENDQQTNEEQQEQILENETIPDEHLDGNGNGNGNGNGHQDGENVGKVKSPKLKVGEDELEGKISQNGGGNEGSIEQHPSTESEISEPETKGRFKIKNVKPEDLNNLENKSSITEGGNENQEVKGRFKVKNVKIGEEGKETPLSPIDPNNIPDGSDRPRSKSTPHINNGVNANMLATDSLSTSVSATSLNTLANTSTPSIPNSAKKGRFTVTTGGVNSSSSSVPSSPMKPQTPVQEILHNNQSSQLSNGPVQFTDALPTSTASSSTNSSTLQPALNPLPTNQISNSIQKYPEEKNDLDGQISVGIALGNSTQSLPSSTKKPKSRFTVKTISLEEEKESLDGLQQQQQHQGPLPPLPHFSSNPLPKTISQTLQGMSSYPRSKSSPDISYTDISPSPSPAPPPLYPHPSTSSSENGSASFYSPPAGSYNRLQQLLDSNLQIMIALQQEMKSHGINHPGDLSNSTNTSHHTNTTTPSRVTIIPPQTHQNSQKTFNPEKLISIIEDQPSDSHGHHLSSNSGKSSLLPSSQTSSIPSNQSNDREKDKSFGKMSHYVNELKKELDYAARIRKEQGLETQRLRERCIQLEEKLQGERNKNILLEEQLEKSLKKQRDLQSQLDMFLISHHNQQNQLQQQQQQQQPLPQPQHSNSTQMEGTNSSNNNTTIPLPPPGTPTGTSNGKSIPTSSSSSSSSQSSSFVTCAGPPPLHSSTSGPISVSNAIPAPLPLPIPSANNNSTLNIPSLGIPAHSTPSVSVSAAPAATPAPPPISTSSSSTLNVTPLTSPTSSNSIPLQTLNPMTATLTSVATPRLSGNLGSNPLHENILSTHGITSGSGTNNIPIENRTTIQRDEFDNFFASRGDPGEKWTDTATTTTATTTSTTTTQSLPNSFIHPSIGSSSDSYLT